MTKGVWLIREAPIKDSLLNLRDELCLECAGGQERLRGLSFKQQLVLGQPHQQQPNDFSQIHAADHLLKATGENKQRNEQESQWTARKL